jgi:hypothetical protein
LSGPAELRHAYLRNKLGNYQIRKVAEHFNRDRAVISQDLKKVELHLRGDKDSKEAMAVLENKLIKNKKRMKT